ncbi:MAG TPA: hypothetical protein VFP89_08450 [Propionibacteriaceae bacterium]|nr:hypothetical protein [Propionibacteriaceae bacterium]
MRRATTGAAAGAQPGRWWRRSRGLPGPLHHGYRQSLASSGERASRILAWARTAEGVCIGTLGRLSYGDGEHWVHVGWHDIERGGWNAETAELTWTLYDGSSGRLELPEPGRMPELFRERVAASIVLERFVPVRGGRGLRIVGRRELGQPDAGITWHTTLGRGLNPDDEGVQAVAERALAAVRTEYDIG